MSKGARLKRTPKVREERDVELLPRRTPKKYQDRSKYTGAGERKAA